MSRRSFYYDKDLDMVIERRGNYFEEKPRTATVIGDGMADTYNPGTGNWYDSWSRYKRDTRAKGMHILERGESTDGSAQRRAADAALGTSQERGQAIKTAIEQIQGNYNGTADRLRRNQEH